VVIQVARETHLEIAEGSSMSFALSFRAGNYLG
jgi:hypothetical protein